MSEILKEEKLSIYDAAALFQGRTPGKNLCFSTIWRWILKGAHDVDGNIVRLEAVRLGGRWVTSREAIARFSENLTKGESIDSDEKKINTSSAERKRADQAAKKLKKLGI